jgi:hypothetical protein
VAVVALTGSIYSTARLAVGAEVRAARPLSAAAADATQSWLVSWREQASETRMYTSPEVINGESTTFTDTFTGSGILLPDGTTTGLTESDTYTVHDVTDDYLQDGFTKV